MQLQQLLQENKPKNDCDFGLHSCTDCPFKGAKVGWRGNPAGDLVIVAESPGTSEVLHKPPMPLVGPSGALLWDALGIETKEQMAALEEYAFITNALQCKPTDSKKDQKVMAGAVHQCQGRLLEEITAYPRKLIIALGNSAVWGVTENFSHKITQIRGTLLKTPLAELGILPAIHPAALMRGTGSLRQFTGDMEYAMQLYRGGVPRKQVDPHYKVVNNLGALKRLRNKVRKGWDADADIETTGFSRTADKIQSIGISNDPRMVYIIPDTIMHHPYTREILDSPLSRWCWHNGKFDISFTQRDGLGGRVDEDTMLMSYALDEVGGVHDLDQIGVDFLNIPAHKGMLDQWTKGKHGSYAKVPRPILYKYQAIDIAKTGLIKRVLRPRIDGSKDLKHLYRHTLLRYSNFLVQVEKNGVYVDTKELAKNKDILIRRVEEGREELCKIADLSHNPNSPQQVSEILYVKFKLPNPANGGTGKDVLEKLPPHPYVVALQKYRKAAKALSTYVISIEAAICEDGRVHSTYLIHGTRTGRLSSREPNMQNITRPPIDDDGTEPNIRAQFAAPPGRRLIAIDYNQAELRVLAAVSGDPDLIRVYRETKRSLHKEVARDKFGENYNHEQYMKTKNVNFGIVYGITEWGLAEQLKSSVAEAKEFLDWWLARFPVAAAFLKRCRKAAMQAETLTTCFGRKKRHWVVSRDNIKGLMNEASNFFPQSIASDFTGHTGMELHEQRLLEPYDAFPINVIHDEVLLEAPDDDEICRKVIQIGIEVAEAIPARNGIKSVPFIAEAKTGVQWGRMKEYKA